MAENGTVGKKDNPLTKRKRNADEVQTEEALQRQRQTFKVNGEACDIQLRYNLAFQFILSGSL